VTHEVTGKSLGASTAKRTVGGAAVGTIIGAVAAVAREQRLARPSMQVLAPALKSSLRVTCKGAQ
jgi:hypothetical protein